MQYRREKNILKIIYKIENLNEYCEMINNIFCFNLSEYELKVLVGFLYLYIDKDLNIINEDPFITEARKHLCGVLNISKSNLEMKLTSLKRKNAIILETKENKSIMKINELFIPTREGRIGWLFNEISKDV